jgi:hypothetical protein
MRWMGLRGSPPSVEIIDLLVLLLEEEAGDD